MKEKYKKYCDLVRVRSYSYDKAENCNIGQTWKYHLLPVIDNSIMLVKKYNADLDVVAVAAIFHDYANLIDYKNSDQHHVLGAVYAAEILEKDGFDKSFIERVKYVS